MSAPVSQGSNAVKHDLIMRTTLGPPIMTKVWPPLYRDTTPMVQYI